MVKFKEVFSGLPIPSGTFTRWNDANRCYLNMAAIRIRAFNADPYTFIADPRHFWEFASINELKAVRAMSDAEFRALMGNWTESDWNPESFGLSYPIV